MNDKKLELTLDEWAYKYLTEGIDNVVAEYLRKIELLKEMKSVIPAGKTKEYYEMVYGATPLCER